MVYTWMINFKQQTLMEDILCHMKKTTFNYGE